MVGTIVFWFIILGGVAFFAWAAVSIYGKFVAIQIRKQRLQVGDSEVMVGEGNRATILRTDQRLAGGDASYVYTPITNGHQEYR
jgi:hypothetical protein